MQQYIALCYFVCVNAKLLTCMRNQDKSNLLFVLAQNYSVAYINQTNTLYKFIALFSI